MDWSQRSYYRRQRRLRSYTVALAVLSIAILLMPIVSKFKSSTRIPMYMVGVLFWIALISTIVIAIKINGSRRRSVSFNLKYEGRKKLGLIHFFQNKKAAIMDITMFASVIAFIIARFLMWNITVQFLFSSIFVFSFGMHCMLNGINYIYIKDKAKVRRG